jgi:uncharacterized coiled-coil DUF342 family protein
MEQDRLTRVEEGFDKMRGDISDIKTSIALLTQTNAKIVDYQEELVKIREDMIQNNRSIDLIKSDVGHIKEKMSGYKENFDTLTKKVSEVENSTDKRAYAILKWLLGAVGVILVAYVMSRLGFK